MAFPTGWDRRVKLTIQNGKVPSNATDFTALLTEANLPVAVDEMFDADGAHPAINGGGDLRASSDEAGSTQISLHVVSFVTNNDPSLGTAELHVKVPSVASATDTKIYLWSEKAGETQPAVGAAFGRNSVWALAEVAVLMEDSVPVDSTGNHTLSLAGGLTSIDGPFGKANSFAGNDRLSNADAALRDIPTTYDTTVSIISRRAAYDGTTNTVMDWDGTDDLIVSPMDTLNGDGLRIFWRDLGGNFINVNGETLANTWIWTDFTTRASNDHEAYTNGASVATATDTGTAGPFSTFDIGGRGATANDFDGDIAQVIVWKTARTADWLTTLHNSQFSPATFIIDGTPEAPAAGGANPKGPLGMPLIGPFGGPIG